MIKFFSIPVAIIGGAIVLYALGKDIGMINHFSRDDGIAVLVLAGVMHIIGKRP
jgi:hypothetical protein